MLVRTAPFGGLMITENVGKDGRNDFPKFCSAKHGAKQTACPKNDGSKYSSSRPNGNKQNDGKHGSTLNPWV